MALPEWATPPPQTSEPLFSADLDAIEKKGIRARSEAQSMMLEMSQGALSRSDVVDDTQPRTGLQTFIKPETRSLLFVSTSLGDKMLVEMLKEASATNLTVVFRGLHPEVKNIGQMIKYLHQLIRKTKVNPPADVILDPSLFSEHQVASVPTLLLPNSDGTQFARVEGLYNLSWLQDKTDERGYIDFGIQGPISEIVERDLIEEMQSRAASLDFEKIKKDAMEGYWTHAQFEELVPATEYSQRRFAPIVEATADITAANGKVIVPAGTRINQLEQMPFNMELIVFDATSKQQVSWAKKRISQSSSLRTMLITTRFDRAASWKGVKKLEDTFDQPVFLLPPDVRNRFQLRYVPSTVSADNRTHEFVIEEFNVEDEG